MAIRFLTLTAIFGFLFGLVGFNLYRLQVEQRLYYVERAQARNETLKALELRRGQIFFTDRSGTRIPVAVNRDYPVIYAVPKEVRDPATVGAQLSSMLGLAIGPLEVALGNRESLFKLLVDKAATAQIAAVEAERIPGIYIDQKQYRYYPFESLGSQILGFVGVNETHDQPTGLYGIEKRENASLAEGSSVALTIDRNLQSEAEQVLQALIADQQATGGTIIIEEPSTGRILAMASKPDFNPDDYQTAPVSHYVNPAVQLVYEPGSAFKPLTMAAGIDSGALTPETTFVDRGAVTLNGKTIRNWDLKAYGTVSMTTVIERSINTGAVFAEQQVGHTRFIEYLKRFGFGVPTGVDLPDEVVGSIHNLERRDVRAVDFATASFGQGTAVTPLQLAAAFSAIANGGVLMEPHVAAEAVPRIVRRVVSEETSRAVIGMMESAVEKAKVAAIPHYRVAGKTGTAFIPDFVNGGYTDELIHTYVGMAPASAPRFVLLIKLDKPKVDELAGATVVPAFRRLASFILNYYRIPPDKVDDATPVAAAFAPSPQR